MAAPDSEARALSRGDALRRTRDVCRRTPELRGDLCLLTVYSAIVFGIAIVSGRPLSLHEAVLPQTARSMFADHDFVVPKIDAKRPSSGEATMPPAPWLENPPLPQWSTVAIASLFGRCDTEAIVRIGPTLYSILTVLCVAWVAALWFGRGIGVLSGLAMATTLEFTRYAWSSEDEIHLCGIMAVVMALFVKNEFGLPNIGWSSKAEPPLSRLGFFRVLFGKRSLWLLAFFVALGVTNLVKGLLFGAVMAGAPIAVFLLGTRDFRRIAKYVWVWALLAYTVVMFAWPAAIYARYPDVTDLWFFDLGGRVSGNYTVTNAPIWYYPVNMLWMCAPWTVLVPFGLWATWKRCWNEPTSPERFLWCWAFVVPIVFSIPGGKHHHYLLHCAFAVGHLRHSGGKEAARDLADLAAPVAKPQPEPGDGRLAGDRCAGGLSQADPRPCVVPLRPDGRGAGGRLSDYVGIADSEPALGRSGRVYGAGGRLLRQPPVQRRISRPLSRRRQILEGRPRSGGPRTAPRLRRHGNASVSRHARTLLSARFGNSAARSVISGRRRNPCSRNPADQPVVRAGTPQTLGHGRKARPKPVDRSGRAPRRPAHALSAEVPQGRQTGRRPLPANLAAPGHAPTSRPAGSLRGRRHPRRTGPIPKIVRHARRLSRERREDHAMTKAKTNTPQPNAPLPNTPQPNASVPKPTSTWARLTNRRMLILVPWWPSASGCSRTERSKSRPIRSSRSCCTKQNAWRRSRRRLRCGSPRSIRTPASAATASATWTHGRGLEGFDLAALQEVRNPPFEFTGPQVADVAERLQMGWIFVPAERRWWHDHYGNALLTRLPLVDYFRIPLPTPSRQRFRAALLTNFTHWGRTVHVLTVHIDKDTEGDTHDIQLRTAFDLFLSLNELAIFLGRPQRIQHAPRDGSPDAHARRAQRPGRYSRPDRQEDPDRLDLHPRDCGRCGPSGSPIPPPTIRWRGPISSWRPTPSRRTCRDRWKHCTIDRLTA